MELINAIHRNIIRIIIEILVIVILITLFLTLIYQQSFQEIFQEISYFKKTNFTQFYIEPNDFSYTIHVVNETYTKEAFQLIMKIHEDIIHPEMVSIKINDHSFFLNDLEKKSNHTFLLLNDVIMASEKKYVIEFENLPYTYAEFYLENVFRV